MYEVPGTYKSMDRNIFVFLNEEKSVFVPVHTQTCERIKFCTSQWPKPSNILTHLVTRYQITSLVICAFHIGH